MNSVERVHTALHLGQPDRVPVLEFVVDEKVARAAVPGCRDVADCMDRLDMDGVGCGAQFEPVREHRRRHVRRRVGRDLQAEPGSRRPSAPRPDPHAGRRPGLHAARPRRARTGWASCPTWSRATRAAGRSASTTGRPSCGRPT